MKIENIDYTLNKKQKSICNKIQNLITQAEKSGVYLFDNYGTLTAINGDVVKSMDDKEEWEFQNRYNLKKINFCDYEEDGFLFKMKNLSPCADDSQIIELKDNFKEYTND